MFHFRALVCSTTCNSFSSILFPLGSVSVFPLPTQVSHRYTNHLKLHGYPVNELWNSLPADRIFNQNVKRDRIPSLPKLQKAQPHIAAAYSNYERQKELRKAVREDATLRFSNLENNDNGNDAFATTLAAHTVRFIEQVAQSRSVARF